MPLKALVEQDGSVRIQTLVCGSGGNGEEQGGMEWWEVDRRKKDIGEKRGERKRWEDDIRERDEARRGGEGGGRGRKGGR